MYKSRSGPYKFFHTNTKQIDTLSIRQNLKHNEISYIKSSM